MLKKVYIHNFRCFQNFELELNSIQLFLGDNGSGKSSFLDVLWKLKQVIVEQKNIRDVFSHKDLTRWTRLTNQDFKVFVQGEGNSFEYEIRLEFDQGHNKVRLIKEILQCNGRPLYSYDFNEGELATLYRDDYSQGPGFHVDWDRCGISSISKRHDNTKLSWFKDFFEKLMFVRINPGSVDEISDHDDVSMPDYTMKDFASWYRYLSQAHQDVVFEVTNILRNVVYGFRSFSIKGVDELKKLEVKFDSFGDEYTLGFKELSDGQRSLMILYTVLYAALKGSLIIFDEPDNYLALSEIQPVLTEIHDHCMSEKWQAIIISHHPENIDYLANQSIYFKREDNGHVRANTLKVGEDEPLKVSELVARGWFGG